MPGTMHPGKLKGAYLLIPSPKLCYDAIMPRGPQGDCFVRPIIEGKIVPSRSWENMGLNFPDFSPKDLTLKRKLAAVESIQIDPLLSSIVAIQIIYINGEESMGSGVPLGKDLVATCEHVFLDKEIRTIGIIKGSSIYSGRKCAIPDDAYDNVHWDKASVEGVKMMPGKQLDLAFIRLNQTVAIPADLQLHLPPCQSTDHGNIVCVAGYPGLPPNDISFKQLFSSRTINTNSHIPRDKLELALKDVFVQVWNNFEGPVAAFGNSLEEDDIPESYYRRATFSNSFGMSGSPVIGLDNPTVLLGIVVGGFEGADRNIYLSFKSEEVQQLIDKFT